MNPFFDYGVYRGPYRHFKGGLYTVHSVARHSETLEQLVVYSDPKGNTWVRPIAMFKDNVIVDGVQKPRFERVVGGG